MRLEEAKRAQGKESRRDGGPSSPCDEDGIWDEGGEAEELGAEDQPSVDACRNIRDTRSDSCRMAT